MSNDINQTSQKEGVLAKKESKKTQKDSKRQKNNIISISSVQYRPLQKN